MPSTDVELSGMTINLIEDKATFDAMTKNPNEMYLVEKDYELEFNVITAWSDSESKYKTNVELISGDINDVLKKLLNSDHDYYPRAKFNIMSWYIDIEYTRSLVLDCIVKDTNSDESYPYNKTLLYSTNEMVSIGPEYDIGEEYITRFGIQIGVSDIIGDNNAIFASFSSGKFGIGNSTATDRYAYRNEVTLGYFID